MLNVDFIPINKFYYILDDCRVKICFLDHHQLCFVSRLGNSIVDALARQWLDAHYMDQWVFFIPPSSISNVFWPIQAAYASGTTATTNNLIAVNTSSVRNDDEFYSLLAED